MVPVKSRLVGKLISKPLVVGSVDTHPTEEKEVPKLDGDLAAQGQPAGSKRKRPSNALDKARTKLSGARFRILNEKLYTNKAEDAEKLFKEQPSAFYDYHTGFVEQVQKWPVVPAKIIAERLVAGVVEGTEVSYPWLSENSFPRKPTESDPLVVADIGCGEASIAQVLMENPRTKPFFHIHSFDLVAMNQYVTACNMVKLPLKDAKSWRKKLTSPDERCPNCRAQYAAEGEKYICHCPCDVVIYCLSLMATDWIKSIEEARRIMKDDGKLVIFEVSSRVRSPAKFVYAIESRNFKLIDCKNYGYFVELIFGSGDGKLSRIPKELNSLTKAQVSQDSGQIVTPAKPAMIRNKKGTQIPSSKAGPRAIIEKDRNGLVPCIYKRR